MWNSFRTLGEHHSQLSVALDVLYVYKFVKCSYFKFNGFLMISEGNSLLRFIVVIISEYLHAVYLLRRSSLPSLSSLARWFGEPVRAAIINSNVRSLRGCPLFLHLVHLILLLFKVRKCYCSDSTVFSHQCPWLPLFVKTTPKSSDRVFQPLNSGTHVNIQLNDSLWSFPLPK